MNSYNHEEQKTEQYSNTLNDRNTLTNVYLEHLNSTINTQNTYLYKINESLNKIEKKIGFIIFLMVLPFISTIILIIMLINAGIILL